MDAGPFSQPFQHGAQSRTAFRKSVGIVAGGGFWIRSFDEIQAGKELKSGRQNIGRNLLRGFEQLGISPWAVDDQITNDEQRPFIAKDVQG